VLIPQHGNECALITTAYAPCRMEIAGDTPDLQRCELAGSARAIDFASFDTIAAASYPD
jgi:hypothetical protein